MRAKVERFTVEASGLVKILHCPEFIVPSGETACKVVQKAESKVPLWVWVKVECFSVEDNGLVEVRRCSELLVPSEETSCKDVQRR